MKLPYTTPELLSTHFRIPSTQLQSYFILNISTSLVHGGVLIPISSLLADSLVLVLLSYPRTRHPETPIPFYSVHSRSHFISGSRPRVPSPSYSSLSLHFTPLVPPHPYPVRSHSPGGTYTYARNPDELSTQKLQSANHPAAPLPLYVYSAICFTYIMDGDIRNKCVCKQRMCEYGRHICNVLRRRWDYTLLDSCSRLN